MAADDDHGKYNTTIYSNFPARTYLKRYGNPRTDPGIAQWFFLNEFHSFYEKYARRDDSMSLLEIGGGPSLHSLISAAKHVGSITFAEYAETNRKEILHWRDRDEGSQCKSMRVYRIVWSGYQCTSFTIDSISKILLKRTKKVHQSVYAS